MSDRNLINVVYILLYDEINPSYLQNITCISFFKFCTKHILNSIRRYRYLCPNVPNVLCFTVLVCNFLLLGGTGGREPGRIRAGGGREAGGGGTGCGSHARAEDQGH